MKTMKIWRKSRLSESHVNSFANGRMGAIYAITFVMLAVFSLTSCDKDDPFEETDTGKNTLGFLLNGKKVEYAWQQILPFTDYGCPVYAMEDYMGNDTLYINAVLESIEELRGSNYISIKLPITKLSPGAVLENVADIELPYLAGSEQEGGITHNYSQNLDITSSCVGIRTCKRGEVLSGTFEFEGDAHFMDGTGKHCKITEGHFDVEWHR